MLEKLQPPTPQNPKPICEVKYVSAKLYIIDNMDDSNTRMAVEGALVREQGKHDIASPDETALMLMDVHSVRGIGAEHLLEIDLERLDGRPHDLAALALLLA